MLYCFPDGCCAQGHKYLLFVIADLWSAGTAVKFLDVVKHIMQEFLDL
jgi:hypothetical protein